MVRLSSADPTREYEAQHRAGGETFAAVLERRLSRRTLLKGSAGGAVALTLVGALGPLGQSASMAAAQGGITLTPIRLSTEDRIIVPEGYSWSVLIAWGDPIAANTPRLDPANQTAALQSRQFGYNSDGMWFFPLPVGSKNGNNGILSVNHEYTNPELMFPGYDPKAPTREQVDIQMAAHGLAFVEVARGQDGRWGYGVDSSYNRRITASTEMTLTGPAAGHDWLRTSMDSSGTRVLGTLNNCSAGGTPWGTILTCEENFQGYFANLNGLDELDPRRPIHRRYGVSPMASEQLWEQYHDRFDVAKEPNEAFRFGWVVEIDPYDPTFTPRKRTALGRFRHEAATVKIAADGRAAVYTGDDERFDYMYKFVSTGRYNPADRKANFTLLDTGTLYVAKFNDNGTGEWLPLVYGQGALGADSGFHSQAEVLINARRAGDLLGATRMDRPEDIEPNPVNGKIYAAFTFNERRTASQTDAANPRAENNHGHIIEITENSNDAAATGFTWEMFLLCGDPSNASHGVYAAGYDTSKISPISSPDNIAFDSSGNLWISTDGQIRPASFGMNDGVYVVPTAGPERGYVRQVVSGVPGGETASLAFTPNDAALFVSIQHPAEGSSYDAPSSTFPDGRTPPRPGVITVLRTAPGSETVGA